MAQLVGPKAGAFAASSSCSMPPRHCLLGFPMNRRLLVALRASRRRCAARIGQSEQSRAPRWCDCGASSWHGCWASSSASTPNWAPSIGQVQPRRYLAAPARVGEKSLDEKVDEDEIYWRPGEMEKAEWSRDVRCAQRYLMNYLYVTRSISFSDAENMSKHSPTFVRKLLERVKDAMKEPAEVEGNVEFTYYMARKMRDLSIIRAMRRLFNFNPINEFEPFFESIGLRPDEYHSLLPQHLMFLADDEILLHNYKILCNYGIARTKIGRIYRDATEVFSFGEGVLASKLKALEELGFSKTSVIRLVISTPVVLVRDPNVELEILQWLHHIGIQVDWIIRFLSAKKSYNWRRMVEVPQFFSKLGFTEEGIGKLIRQDPGFLLDGSGKLLFTVALIMLKAGCGKEELFDLFLNFPKVPIQKFVMNLQKGITFLSQISLNDEDIKKLVISNVSVMGCASLMTPNSVLRILGVGKVRLCMLIMEDPSRLMNYTKGSMSKLSVLPKFDVREILLKEKVKFLKGIGFVEGSEDMNKALRDFRGRGDELQRRYDFLVKTGFDPKDVVNMIKAVPDVLNQKIHVIQYKISFLVNDAGYPMSALVTYPSSLLFNVERTKERVLMRNWLVERGVTPPQVALSSFLSKEKYFIKYFVKKHPEGPEVWENIKMAAYAKKIPST